jgi:uncharacterized membrane protein
MDQLSDAACERVPDNGRRFLGRKAWTAYVKPAFIGCLVTLIAGPATLRISEPFGVVVILAGFLWLVYRIALERSYRLFFNGSGVW